MPTREDRWLDEAAGPVVRPYALTPGGIRVPAERLDLVTMIIATRQSRPARAELVPEHWELLRRCQFPSSVAELAGELDLPLGVIQTLLADLRDRALVRAHAPVPAAQLAGNAVLREVADALRRL